ncbi:MAG: DUF4926 domain-containing protein [Clostridia bacterium]|nr:DUF4926 domain-containing protein [Clostridia bacterium]
MPYSKCPNCNQQFHLQVRKDIEKWYKEHAPDKNVGDEVNLICYGCWKDLKEYEIVRVLKKPMNGCNVQIGDIGTVLMVLDNSKEISYEVECVLPDGSTKWVETFKRNQLKYDIELNK